MESIEATLLPEFVEVKLGNQQKIVSYEDFASQLNGIVSDSLSEDSSFQLPQNCFYLNKTSADVRVMMYYPEQTHDVKFMDRLIPKVVFPNIVISCHFHKEGGTHYVASCLRYFATNRSWNLLPTKFVTCPSKELGLIPLPLPNMYDSGAICLGGNSHIPPIDGVNLRGVDWYYQLLYTAPFNNDLSVPGVGRYCEAWLDSLSEVSEFPYHKFSFGDNNQ